MEKISQRKSRDREDQLIASARFVRWFEDVRLDDIALVGGKTASLGELYGALAPKGVRVPNGFAITADADRIALINAGARDELHRLLDGLDKKSIKLLAAAEACQNDEFYVHKPTLKQGYRAVLSRSLGDKQKRMVYARGCGAGARTQNVATTEAECQRFCISDTDVLTLADYAIIIEDHFSAIARPFHADGYRVCEGRTGRGTLYPASASRHRCIAKRSGRLRDIRDQANRAPTRERPCRRREDRIWSNSNDISVWQRASILASSSRCGAKGA